TSAPELAVSTAASVRGDPGLALGNVVGSNVLNVLLILGLSAVVAPLVVERRLVRLEVPFMILASLLVMALAIDGRVGRVEGAGLLVTGLAYTTVLVLRARAVAPPLPGGTGAIGTARRAVAANAAMTVLGLLLLVLGSRWLVQGALAMAESLGVPDLVVGLTIVAAGTSLPELATSVVASVRGQRDIAVGNVVGSNIFNLLIILGAAAGVSTEGLEVPLSALTFDLPVMLAVAVACLPVFVSGLRIDRAEGLIFLGFYVAYTGYLVLDAADHYALPILRDGILFFALPLAVLALAATGYRDRPTGPDRREG
ncbi:MAG: calcium/sodium antiporter, partial [Gemmatimonadetes bacterium]|nr:calcium/sodium antiporter [Gemmatimonadota bacterium]NIQ54453.1 calcium/sodium antiporter [Gemmatimonadota bacterium]NIU74661.1 calcium/sodium antiporter [Gammaproteobacteria bacterium]NIX44592.1 calcium/sodium antiporter [Gemmatimonadota bacterium]NIY08802.1 calcium/sodium antiporter [Gemmatimonadota bacterium]